MTGMPSFLTAARTRRPSSRPGPRNDEAVVRLALSYEACGERRVRRVGGKGRRREDWEEGGGREGRG
jgi:hypothetical protein